MSFIGNFFNRIVAKQTVTAVSKDVPGSSGVQYTPSRFLGSGSTFSLTAGSHNNLTIVQSTGVVSATGAIDGGTSQVAVLRESFNNMAVEYPVTLVSLAPPVQLMPDGAILSLYAKDVDGRYNIFRNRSENTALPSSFWGNARPGNNSLVPTLSSGGATVTKDGTGADGAALAIKITWSSGANGPGAYFMGIDNNLFPGARVLPAGTYTIAYDLRSQDGTTAVMKLESLVGGFPTTPNHDVTSTWQRFSYTFTLTAETIIRLRIYLVGTASAAGEVLMDNITLTSGSAATAPSGPDRHFLKVGKFAKSGQTILIQPQSNNVVGLEGQTYGAAGSNGTSVSINAVTIVAALKFTDANYTSNGVYMLSSNGQPNASRIDASISLGSLSWGSPANGANILLPAAGLDKAGWTTAIFRGGPNGLDIFLDGICVGSVSAAFGTWLIKEWQLGGRNYANAFPGMFAQWNVYHNALTDAEVVQAHRSAKSEILGLGETYQEPTHYFIAEGASNTNPSTTSYISVTTRLLTKRVNFRSFAVPGSGLGTQGETSNNSVWGRSSRVASQIAAIKALGRQPVVTLLCGSNDGTRITANPIAYAQAHEDYWAWVRSQGALIIPATLTAFQPGSSPNFPNNTDFEAFNNSLRARASAGKCDALADFASTSLGTWNADDYVDNVHMSAVGHTKAANVLKTAIASIAVDRT